MNMICFFVDTFIIVSYVDLVFLSTGRSHQRW